MRAVRSKNTGPEIQVRRYLWSQGIRYRLHMSEIPGSPDIVIPKHKVAIFVHGCFWHGHENCSQGRLPKSRTAYWREKISSNKIRDVEVGDRLARLGWRRLTIWGCQLRTHKASSVALPKLLSRIREAIDGLDSEVELGRQLVVNSIDQMNHSRTG